MTDTEKFSALYYGRHLPPRRTMWRMLLLYDELHFLDHPSFSLQGSFGTVGAASPLRGFNDQFPDADIAVVCHEPHSGVLNDAMKATVAADLEDPAFRNSFIDSFFSEAAFRRIFVVPDGKYPMRDKSQMTGEEIVEAMRNDSWDDLDNLSLYEVEQGHDLILEMTTPEARRVTMGWFMCEAAFTLNVMMFGSTMTEAVPLTDLAPFHTLLGVKYRRAKAEGIVPSTGLLTEAVARTVVDGVLSSAALDAVPLDKLLSFRRKHEQELAAFRRYLARLRLQIESEPWSEELEAELNKLVTLEVMPTAEQFRDEITKSWEDVVKGVVGGVAASSSLALLVSLAQGQGFDGLLTAGAISAWTVKPVSDFIVARRRVRRQNALAYLMRFQTKR